MSQPRYARGLQLVRIGVFMALIQSLLSLALIGKAVTGGLDDPMSLFRYAQYGVWSNLAAAIAMLAGALLAFPDFRKARLPVHLVVIAIACFAVASGALYWVHHVMADFLAVVSDPDGSIEDMTKAINGLGVLGFATTLKDFAYVIGLIAMMRTVKQSAVANEQYDLRDAAGTVTQLVVVMLVSDVFYQFTYGLGSGASTVPFLGLAVAVAVGLYWVYCHLRLAKFLKAAAILVSEPHILPTATVIKVPSAEALAPKPRPSAPKLPREVTATPSAPIIVVAPDLHTAAPRAESSSEAAPSDRPKFLS